MGLGKKLGTLLVLGGLLFIGGRAGAQEDTNCTQLRQQLAAMQKAQASLLQSMVSKNDSMAQLFEQYARDFESEDRRLKKGDIESLHNSAEAFRRHRERERQLVEKFELHASELLQKTSACLAQAGHLKSSSTKLSTSAEMGNSGTLNQ